ncbi:winged helix DNA-binding domain-containing protein [Dactylosporangium sp. NPDC049140]|uniref:winged helix DNA-binding domain-containing protein n=1 Tax=Dactylosporangium sp. NPDC049140 TaxID=3155647 RepID=UPI0033DDD431
MTVEARRMRAQLLSGPPADGVLGAVERVVGVQAQSWPAARLAVRARTRGAIAEDVDAALARGELARTWLMRGTLHLVAAADLGWLTELFGPLNRAAGQRRREELGVTDAVAERALAELPGVLAGAGPMERGELVARLAHRGVRVDPSGQAPAHLVAYAASAGVVCRGPDVSGRPTVLLADEIRAAPAAGGPRQFSGDAALAELARRYLLGYGPADEADLAAWSGLPLPTARLALTLCAGSASLAAAVPPPRLLGAFDTLLLGYRDRAFILPPEHVRRVNAGGGMIAPTLLVDGRVAGVWRRSGRRVVLRPFGPFRPPGSVRGALEAEVRGALDADVRGVLDADVRGVLDAEVRGALDADVRGVLDAEVRGALDAEVRGALEAEVADLARFVGERLTPAWEDA